MMHTPDTRRLGLVVGLAVVLVAATPAPNTGQYGPVVTPTPVPTRTTMKPTPTATPRPTPTATAKVTPTPTATAHPTPTPTPTPIIDHTPPPKLVLSDTIQFDGPQFCRLTSDTSDHDANPAGAVGHEIPGPQHCRITAQHYGATGGIATITVPGNPEETIYFKYTMTGSTVTPGAAKEVEHPGAAPYPATITGTMHGIPGSPTFYGIIKVWESSTAP